MCDSALLARAARSSSRVPRRRQGGQALIEAFVGLLALVPLLGLVIWLGKVQALRQSTIDASRLVAFECTVRAAACAGSDGHARLADEARRRVFSTAQAPVRSDEILADAAAREAHNPLWHDGSRHALLSGFGQIGVAVQAPAFDAGLSVATARESALVNNALDFLTRVAGPGRFGLAITEGLWVATVQTAITPGRHGLPALAPQARTAILGDAWTATGPDGGAPDTVAARTERGAALWSPLEAAIDARYLPTLGFIDLMGAIGLEPTGGAFRYHRSDVDVVPPDRVGVAP